MERIADFPDLGPAFVAGLLSFDEPRGDEALPHVSDLGKCDFAVWARRNGEPMIGHGPKTAARLQMGLHAENFVTARIKAGLPPDEGWHIVTELVLVGDDGMTGHLDAILARAKCPTPKCDGAWCSEIRTDQSEPKNLWVTECDLCGRSFYEEFIAIERAYFDVKTTTFREVWRETGEFFPDTGKPVKRKTWVPYDDFPGPMYHFQSGGYCRRLPKNPDGKHPPYAIAAFDWNSKAFVPFGWFDSDAEGFVLAHDVETKRKLAVTAPGTDPVAAGIAIVRGDGALAGIPPEDSLRSSGKSWMCGYCDYARCALNTNPDAEVL